jgi:hypothetical protein
MTTKAKITSGFMVAAACVGWWLGGPIGAAVGMVAVALVSGEW